jgi:CRISPR system Cascade subunit CasE
MSEEFWFTRLTLKRDSGTVAPLIAVLAPDDGGEAMSTIHRLMWSVMPEAQQRRWDRAAPERPARAPFLWREVDRARRYYLLGPRPVENSPYFEVETKPFSLALSPGDCLSFDLRVHATVDRKFGERAPGYPLRKRIDVAMDALLAEERGKPDEKANRAGRRAPAAETAAREWLKVQGPQNGFRLLAMGLAAYRVERVPRGRGNAARLGVFDVTGLLEITEPDLFGARVRKGFGRAKAFGCGLMLLRRAP